MLYRVNEIYGVNRLRVDDLGASVVVRTQFAAAIAVLPGGKFGRWAEYLKRNNKE